MRYRQAPSVMFKVAVSLLFVAVLVALGDGKTGDHGGIPMGVQTIKCDDAKTYIEIDWDPNSTEEYTCDGDIIIPSKPTIDSRCEKNPQEGIHVCYPSTIQYSDLPPTSGRHRPNWPDYGEYKYVPPQRWLHNLEHGAIVMLYHPCADPAHVDTLRGIVTHCLRKHIITPYKQLPEQTPFALLSWGCKLTMSTVISSVARNFIKTHAKMAPEGRVASKGQYTQSRIIAAATVSDYNDNNICPPDPKNAEDQGTGQNGQNAADGTNTGNQNEQSPPQRPANAIVLQSQRRQQRLNAEADKLHQNVENLIKAYRRLISQT